MKKILVVVLVILICCVALCACSYSTDGRGNDLKNKQPPSVVVVNPTDHYIYEFNSYEDVIQALTTQSTTEYSILRAEQTNYGNVYINTLSAFADHDIKVAVPQLGGSDINLRGKAGYPNASLLTCELYNLPWLWYHCVVNDYDLDVKISYPSVLDSPEINTAVTYYEVLTLIAPGAPSPENFQQFDSYQSIYEEEIVLAGDKVVTAMISEIKDSPKVYVMIYGSIINVGVR